MSVINHYWLQAIDDHPAMTTEDLLAAYHNLGVPTDRTPEQLDASTFRLQVFGFLDVVDVSGDGRTYLYAPGIPEVGA